MTVSARQDPPLAGYRELCRELAAAGPGTFGELDSVGARSVLRRYSDAWFAAAGRRKDGDRTARYPRWAVRQKIGALAVGDPRGVLDLKAGRRHNQRTRDWRVGRLIRVLADKAEADGITMRLVDERGTSSTCPSCARRVPKPAGRNFSCPHCGHGGHRDLVAAASIAARAPGGGPIPATPKGPGSRTVAPEPTYPVCTRRGVTPGAGPHHGPHPGGTWPAPARPPHHHRHPAAA